MAGRARHPNVPLPAGGWGIFVAASVLGACAGSQTPPNLADGVVPRDTTIEHEPCDLDSASAERIDANGDGRPDLTIVRDGDREVCRAVDLNMDGVIDRYSYFDASGKLRRQESDYDRDGRIDEIALYEGGVLVAKHSATTLLHRIDTWHTYEGGRLVRTERDSNGDAIVDQWWEYPTPDCPIIHSDVNNDGRPDPGASIDYCKETGFVPPTRDAQKSTTPRFDTPSETVTEVESSADAAAAESASGESASGEDP